MKQRKLQTVISTLIIACAIGNAPFANAQAGMPEAALNKKINALVSQMTLEEKVRMLHGNSSFSSAGVPRLGDT